MAKPTHRLTLKHKEGGISSSVGVAWPSKNGRGFTIRLNPGIVISHRDLEDHFLGMWEIEYPAAVSTPDPGLRPIDEGNFDFG